MVRFHLHVFLSLTDGHTGSLGKKLGQDTLMRRVQSKILSLADLIPGLH